MNIYKMALIVFSVSFLSLCKGNTGRPEGIPEKATYNRKLNIYVLNEGGYEYGWFENGNLISKTQVNAFGISDGIAERFEYKTGIPIAIGQYKMSEKSGNWQWKYSDGKPYFEMNFSPGVRKRKFWYPTLEWGNENGAYLRYFSNGRVSEKGNYDGGNKSGDWVRYYPDTKIESKGSYVEDHKTGDWFYYYPDGRKEAVENYSETGELIKRITFYPNGSVWCETKKNQDTICF
ncbi:MAG: hypothetical protein SH817_14490 [Leptospira sp.]|nr:hypothetical protein [Leptospira sp.]